MSKADIFKKSLLLIAVLVSSFNASSQGLNTIRQKAVEGMKLRRKFQNFARGALEAQHFLHTFIFDSKDPVKEREKQETIDKTLEAGAFNFDDFLMANGAISEYALEMADIRSVAMVQKKFDIEDLSKMTDEQALKLQEMVNPYFKSKEYLNDLEVTVDSIIANDSLSIDDKLIELESLQLSVNVGNDELDDFSRIFTKINTFITNATLGNNEALRDAFLATNKEMLKQSNLDFWSQRSLQKDFEKGLKSASKYYQEPPQMIRAIPVEEMNHLN